ncbi:MAG: HAD family hydrolase [Bacteroidales bacterium]|nr:HAD family hydrolase [Bacteroidales bacterium]
MNKAVFLDRDGVINNDEGLYYIYRPEDFKINPGIAESIAMLNKSGFLVIVVSNQGGIGKGLYNKEDTEQLHKLLKTKITQNGGRIDEIYYCPHHPDTGLCLCRKPSGLMIEKAIARFSLDKTQCYLIGDSPRDIEAAENAGIKGILVPKNADILPICRSIIEGKIG